MPVLLPHETRLRQIEEFYFTGQRWFRVWEGTPWHNIHLREMNEWLDYEFTGQTKNSYHITEVGPNGGMFTHHLLNLFHSYGLPLHLTYSLYGDQFEHLLVQRDASKLLDRSVKHNEECRVRTYKCVPRNLVDPTLISVVHFIDNQLSKLYDCQKECELIVCYNSIYDYDLPTKQAIIKAMAKKLKLGGTLIINTKHSEADWLRLQFKINGMRCCGQIKDEHRTYYRYTR